MKFRDNLYVVLRGTHNPGDVDPVMCGAWTQREEADAARDTYEQLWLDTVGNDEVYYYVDLVTFYG